MSKSPAQIEAEGDPTTTFEWEGISLTIPSTLDELDVEVLDAFEAGKVMAIVKALLGDSYQKLRDEFAAKHGRGMKVKDLNSLFELIGKTYGLTQLGE